MKELIKEALEKLDYCKTIDTVTTQQKLAIRANSLEWLRWQNERIEQLEKALEWANRIIGSGVDVGANIRYDPAKWLIEYRESIEALEKE